MLLWPLIVLYQCVPIMYLKLLWDVSDRLNPTDEAGIGLVASLQAASTDPEIIPLRFLFRG